MPRRPAAAAAGLRLALLCAVLRPALPTGLGGCPVYPQLPDFDVRKMAGRWYEVERSFYLMELSASCTELDVVVNERGQLLLTVTTTNRWMGGRWSRAGVAAPWPTPRSSVLRYKPQSRAPPALARLLPGAGHYAVLFTDYVRFALVWSCTSLSVAHSDRMWVLGRQRELGAAARAQAYALLEALRLDPDRLILSKNTNCTDADADAHGDAIN